MRISTIKSKGNGESCNFCSRPPEETIVQLSGQSVAVRACSRCIKELQDYLSIGPELLKDKKCPFCGSLDSGVSTYCDDDGETDGIECNSCLASAPRTVWNGNRDCDKPTGESK